MSTAEYTTEYICRFPLPGPLTPFWVSMAGITRQCEDAQNTCAASSHSTIAYVFSGSGTLTTSQGVHPLNAGDLCILEEGTVYAAQADPHDPWVRMVIYLKGTAALPFVQAFGLEKAAIYKSCFHLEDIFRAFFDCIREDSPLEQIMDHCSMLIMKLMTRLCRTEGQESSASEEMQTVKRFIQNNYQNNLSMDDIASVVFRSKDYVQKNFKQTYGLTPYRYYMELKLACAKELLQQTNLPIWQIAEKLGYKSDRYFSAQFRRDVGISAREFRHQSRGTTHIIHEGSITL